MATWVHIVIPPSLPYVGDACICEYLRVGYWDAALNQQPGVSSHIINASYAELSVDQVVACLGQRPSTLIVIFYSFENSREAVRLARHLRGSGYSGQIIAAGRDAALHSTTLVTHEPFDAVVLGLPELVLPALINNLQQSVNWAYGDPCTEFVTRANPVPSGKSDHLRRICLDNLPCPSRYHLVRDGQLPAQHYVLTSLGCNARCTFCRDAAYRLRYSTGSWTARSAESIISEIAELLCQGSTRRFFFCDNNFLVNRNRARRFAELVLEKRLDIEFAFLCRIDDVEYELFSLLKRAGLRHVFPGIESFDDEILRQLKKGISTAQIHKALDVLYELDIEVEFGFMMFTPWSTPDDLELNARFLRWFDRREGARGRAFLKLGSSLHLFPGTPLHNELNSQFFCEQRTNMRGFQQIIQYLWFYRVSPLYELCQVCAYQSTEIFAERAVLNLQATCHNLFEGILGAWKQGDWETVLNRVRLAEQQFLQLYASLQNSLGNSFSHITLIGTNSLLGTVAAWLRLLQQNGTNGPTRS